MAIGAPSRSPTMGPCTVLRTVTVSVVKLTVAWRTFSRWRADLKRQHRHQAIAVARARPMR